MFDNTFIKCTEFGTKCNMLIIPTSVLENVYRFGLNTVFGMLPFNRCFSDITQNQSHICVCICLFLLYVSCTHTEFGSTCKAFIILLCIYHDCNWHTYATELGREC